MPDASTHTTADWLSFGQMSKVVPGTHRGVGILLITDLAILLKGSLYEDIALFGTHDLGRTMHIVASPKVMANYFATLRYILKKFIEHNSMSGWKVEFSNVEPGTTIVPSEIVGNKEAPNTLRVSIHITSDQDTILRGLTGIRYAATAGKDIEQALRDIGGTDRVIVARLSQRDSNPEQCYTLSSVMTTTAPTRTASRR